MDDLITKLWKSLPYNERLSYSETSWRDGAKLAIMEMQDLEADAWDNGFNAGQGSMLTSAGGVPRKNPHRG